MKLYVIENQKDLIGKEILDIHFLSWCLDEIFIITADGGIVGTNLYPSDDDNTIITSEWSESSIISKLTHEKLLKNRLIATGKITQEDIDNFTYEYRVKLAKEVEERKKAAEQEEYEKYTRLKAKYESEE